MGDDSKLPSISIHWPYEKDIGRAIEIANAWLERLLGPAATEIGGVLSDRVQHWRARQALRLVLESRERFSARDISEPQPIPPTVLIPILEAASLETDEELKAWWLELLTNAADPESGVTVTPVFPRILAELSSREVKILDWMYTKGFHSDSLEQFHSVATYQDVATQCEGLGDLHILNFKVIVSNLCRLGLSAPQHITTMGTPGGTVQRYDELDLTPLGAEFLHACHVPGGSVAQYAADTDEPDEGA